MKFLPFCFAIMLRTGERVKKRIIRILLVIGIFYFSFMVLDRALSVIYGFNFQPYGEWAPPAFPIWGHIGNGSAAALGLYLVFKLYDYGTRKGNLFLRILPFFIFAIIGAVIPYMNDARHLAKNGMENTLPVYIIGNDLYVFLTGFLSYKVAGSISAKLILLLVLAVIFICLHFLLYMPMFPDFYWC